MTSCWVSGGAAAGAEAALLAWEVGGAASRWLGTSRALCTCHRLLQQRPYDAEAVFCSSGAFRLR
jgi:hypothetical protein